MKTKIVTRHSGAIEWLKSKGIDGEILSHITESDIQMGDTIYGVLPIQLIATAIKRGAEVNVLVLPNIPIELRGKELTAQEMEDLGGVEIWRVRNLELIKVWV